MVLIEITLKIGIKLITNELLALVDPEGAAGYEDFKQLVVEMLGQDYFKGKEANKTLDPNLHDMSIYNQTLQGKDGRRCYFSRLH